MIWLNKKVVHVCLFINKSSLNTLEHKCITTKQGLQKYFQTMMFDMDVHDHDRGHVTRSAYPNQ